ncbi:hypothetical protein L7F22_028608 [Adiantum nelumboides]|nr:hypothetical protein [Adiantum nelumboides]
MNCEKQDGLKKGPWTPEEDQKLMSYIETHGHSSWRALPKQAGLARCGKSCRLRWTNYLRPGIKRGNFSAEEEESIIQLHALLGNRWSTIAAHLPGRTDNEIKNHWNTRLRKRLVKMGIDPMTHMPCPIPPPRASTNMPAINNLLLSLLHAPGGLPNTVTTGDPLNLLKSNLLNASFTNFGPPLAETSSCSFSPLSNMDSTLLASIESRLIYDCLKLGSSDGNRNSSDDELNRLITRLLLVKLLQQRSSSNGNPANPCIPRSDSKVVNDGVDLGILHSNHNLLHQGLQAMLGTTTTTDIAAHDATKTLTSAPANSQYLMSPSLPKSSSNVGASNTINGGGHFSTLSSYSPYQQRLLHALPFLADMIEPCVSSAATDDVSSNQQLRQLHSSPSSVSAGNLLPPLMWSPVAGAHIDNHSTTPSGSLLGGIPSNLMAWEELLMREPDRDNIASSSTANNPSNSSTLSSASAHATTSPNTPPTNTNMDYWSSLLNLISPNITTHHSS